jgi:hypothetical protein
MSASVDERISGMNDQWDERINGVIVATASKAPEE